MTKMLACAGGCDIIIYEHSFIIKHGGAFCIPYK